jgi:hypothetical protein
LGAAGSIAISMRPSTTRTAWVASAYGGRGAERAAVADIERGAVQRADQARTAQSALVHARVGMRADVVEREHAVTRVTHHQFATTDRAATHLALRQVGASRALRNSASLTVSLGSDGKESAL